MNPLWTPLSLVVLNFPHASGDEPVLLAMQLGQALFSPREWG